MDTAVDLKFADGEYRFWLPLPQLIELERKTGASILELEQRLSAAIGLDSDDQPAFIGGGSAMIADVRETIRLGLIGGNSGATDSGEIEVGPVLAKQLADNYVYPARPLSEGVVLAWRVIYSAIYGVRLKKKADQLDEPESQSPSKKVK